MLTLDEALELQRKYHDQLRRELAELESMLEPVMGPAPAESSPETYNYQPDASMVSRAWMMAYDLRDAALSVETLQGRLRIQGGREAVPPLSRHSVVLWIRQYGEPMRWGLDVPPVGWRWCKATERPYLVSDHDEAITFDDVWPPVGNECEAGALEDEPLTKGEEEDEPLNRDQAVDWLLANLVEWPEDLDDTSMFATPPGWHWNQPWVKKPPLLDQDGPPFGVISREHWSNAMPRPLSREAAIAWCRRTWGLPLAEGWHSRENLPRTPRGWKWYTNTDVPHLVSKGAAAIWLEDVDVSLRGEVN